MDILKNFKVVISCLVFSITTVNLYALYDDKADYSYVNKFADVYVGVYIGNSVTNSWGKEVEQGYLGLIAPQKALSASNIGATFGFRLFQNIPVIRNVRLEGEILYNYVKTKTMLDSTKISSDFDKDSLSKYGMEVLKNSGAINAYYDLRFFSDVFYPYVGAGIGYGKFVIASVDLNAQPNGLGEQYTVTQNGQFNQFMLGLQYDTKIIKSSVYLQYKFMLGTKSMRANPLNDGIHDVQLGNDSSGNKCTIEGNGADCPDLTKPTTSSKSINYINQAISFGFRYYLY